MKKFPLNETQAIEILVELNYRLQDFYARTRTAEFQRKAGNARRAANKNRKGLVDYVNALFDRYARLQVVRLDLDTRSIRGLDCWIASET